MNKNLMLASLTYVSVVVLGISCSDIGFVSDAAKIIWLVFLAIISIFDFGAAFGMLLLSLSLYNPKHVWAPESIFDRIDTCALIIIIIVFVFKRFRLPSHSSLTLLSSMFVFMVYVLVMSLFHGLLNWYNFSELIRMFGLPFFLFLMLQKCSLTQNEIRSFCWVVAIMGAGMAITSILEKFRLHSLIIPPWVGNPAINWTIGSGRSGGLLMQPEFNGLALSLICCVIIANIYLKRSGTSVVGYGLCGLCLIGVYLSYTRGAWLAVIIASIVLPLRYGFRSVNTGYKSIFYFVSIPLLVVFMTSNTDTAVRDRTVDSGTIYYRLNLWYPALKMTKDKPLLGHGIGQFEKIVSQYHESLDVGPKMKMPVDGTGTHNIFLNLLTEHGVVGLLQYVFILISIVSMTYASSIQLWGKLGGQWVLAYTLVYLINIQFLNAHEPVTNALYFGTMGMISGSKRIL